MQPKTDRIQRIKQYVQDGVITTSSMLDAVVLSDIPNKVARAHRLGFADETIAALDKIAREVKTIEQQVKRFEREVWFAGLQQIVRASRSSGMSLKLPNNGPKFLLLCTAGRCLMTIDAVPHYVNLITAEDEGPNHEMRGPKPEGEGPMGLQGLSATCEQAVDLINEATDAWKGGRFALKADAQVRIDIPVGQNEGTS